MDLPKLVPGKRFTLPQPIGSADALLLARLGLRDHKPKYLADTPRFMAYIRATCSRYRELFPLLRLIDRIEGQSNVSGYAFGRV